MKRILVILYYTIVLIGASVPFWNKEYTHHYYGNNVSNIKYDTYTETATGELSHRYYFFDYCNKEGVYLHVKGVRVDNNIKWFETELKKGNYYNSEMNEWWIIFCSLCYISLFFIIIQYIVYWSGGSEDHCSGCPIALVCPASQVCQKAIICDDVIFSKFYKWFGSNFIKFWGYENNS